MVIGDISACHQETLASLEMKIQWVVQISCELVLITVFNAQDLVYLWMAKLLLEKRDNEPEIQLARIDSIRMAAS